MIRRSLSEITRGGERIELLAAAVEILIAVNASEEGATASADSTASPRRSAGRSSGRWRPWRTLS